MADLGPTKVCARCEQDKDRETEYHRRRHNGGIQSWCKDCCRENARQRGRDPRSTVKIPSGTHAALKADARRNNMGVGQYMVKAIHILTQAQCSVPGCLTPAPNERRLCPRCMRLADKRTRG